MAVFLKPVVLLKSASKPVAVLSLTYGCEVSRLKSASVPSAVFRWGYPPSGGGSTARANGESAKQASASAVRNKPCHIGNRLLEFLASEVFVFIQTNLSVPPIG